MPPLFREQHIEERPVRSARGFHRAFVYLTVLVDRANDVGIALDNLFRLFVPDLIRNQHEFRLVRVPEHDIQNGISALIRIFVGRRNSDLHVPAAHRTLDVVAEIRFALRFERFTLYKNLLVSFLFSLNPP